jgi:hypothetical protein
MATRKKRKRTQAKRKAYILKEYNRVPLRTRRQLIQKLQEERSDKE